MHFDQTRRDFLKRSVQLSAGLALAGVAPASAWASDGQPLFKISLAQWSLNSLFTARGGDVDNLDFVKLARQEFGIEAVEYVNQFFFEKAQDRKYIAEMKKRADDQGVKSLLIMCDREGRLGDPKKEARQQAVENHYKWVEAAKGLGCHSIRVNAASAGSYEEQQKLAADGLRKLTEFGAKYDLNVIVENHGGLSSNGKWLSEVIRTVDHPRCGTLPDFGNFTLDRKTGEKYDCYQGVKELMPFAKGVSAKSYGFDDKGNETTIDYRRMMKIVLAAGYKGYVGIEFEGKEMSKIDGVKATKALLEKIREEMAA